MSSLYVIKYMLSTYYVPDTLLDARHTVMNKTDQVHMPWKDILVERLRRAYGEKTKQNKKPNSVETS